MSLPDEVMALVENNPLEDFMLDLLRSKLPDSIRVNSLIDHDQQFPLVLVRRFPGIGEGSDVRFLDGSAVSVHVFCVGIDSDADAANLSEAVRVILRDAWLNQEVIPGRGHLTGFSVSQTARRAADWSTSVGPVQYADLPQGVTRYEAHYQVTIRRPLRRG